MAHPSAGVFVDGPVVHHFDECGWRGYRPGAKEMQQKPWDICASQATLDAMWLATEGGGAEGTPGYIAQSAANADEFYNESTPTWWIPGRYYDLRDTWCSFYLKEIEPITVAPGYRPCLFIAAYMPKGLPRPHHRLSCWYLPDTLAIGKGEWASNEIHLANDPSRWVNYHSADAADTLDEVLAHCGFIGWMYMSEAKTNQPFQGVQANGVIGWDEMRFNLKDPDLEDLRAGRALKNALEL
ncbi:MAG: hypothetical protein ACRDJH_06445 [Thermomicrobiales bacterium]